MQKLQMMSILTDIFNRVNKVCSSTKLCAKHPTSLLSHYCTNCKCQALCPQCLSHHICDKNQNINHNANDNDKGNANGESKGDEGQMFQKQNYASDNDAEHKDMSNDQISGNFTQISKLKSEVQQKIVDNLKNVQNTSNKLIQEVTSKSIKMFVLKQQSKGKETKQQDQVKQEYLSINQLTTMVSEKILQGLTQINSNVSKSCEQKLLDFVSNCVGNYQKMIKIQSQGIISVQSACELSEQCEKSSKQLLQKISQNIQSTKKQCVRQYKTLLKQLFDSVLNSIGPDDFQNLSSDLSSQNKEIKKQQKLLEKSEDIEKPMKIQYEKLLDENKILKENTQKLKENLQKTVQRLEKQMMQKQKLQQKIVKLQSNLKNIQSKFQENQNKLVKLSQLQTKCKEKDSQINLFQQKINEYKSQLNQKFKQQQKQGQNKVVQAIDKQKQ